MKDKKTLSGIKIDKIINDFEKKFYKEKAEFAIQWIKEKLNDSLDCHELVYKVANTVFNQLFIQNMVENDKFDAFILECYNIVLENGGDIYKEQVAYQMYALYFLRRKYDLAEMCLEHMPECSYRKQFAIAQLRQATNKNEDAYKLYEKILITSISEIEMAMWGLITLYLNDDKKHSAREIALKRHGLSELMEMGTYHQVINDMEYLEKDQDFIDDLGYEMNIEQLRSWIVNNGSKMMDMKNTLLFSHLTFE